MLDFNLENYDVIENLSNYASNVLDTLYLNRLICPRPPLLEWPTEIARLSLKNFTNLTHLTICETVFTNDQMQEICKNFKQLIHITLEDHCTALTDYGFTGAKENIQTGYSISNLKNLKVLHINLETSSLGASTLLNIMEIKGLEYLHISCCENLVSMNH